VAIVLFTSGLKFLKRVLVLWWDGDKRWALPSSDATPWFRNGTFFTQNRKTSFGTVGTEN